MKSVTSCQTEIDVAESIRQQRYPDASAVFLAGSIVRGESTIHSDLDLVVVYKQLTAAYRESFIHHRWPVEVFVHDQATLAWFFKEIDGKSGVPSLANMVSEGIELPEPGSFSASCKRMANLLLSEGPAIWSQSDIDASRYTISNLVDDIRQPRSYMEAIASGAALHNALATHIFRTRGMWSASGKMIPRQLERLLPAMAADWCTSFSRLFKTGNSDELVLMTESILEPDGGFLFEHYSQTAPASWRANGDNA